MQFDFSIYFMTVLCRFHCYFHPKYKISVCVLSDSGAKMAALIRPYLFCLLPPQSPVTYFIKVVDKMDCLKARVPIVWIRF